MLRKMIRCCSLVSAVAVLGTQVSVSAQAPVTAGQQPSAGSSPVRRLSVDEVVQLAVQNNLGIQVARVNPQLEDLNLALARANWAPSFNTTVQKRNVENPNTGALSGAGGAKSTTQDTLYSTVG